MKVEVYADVVFGVNLIMNYIVFWITAGLTRCSGRWFKLLAGSAISSLLYCLFFFTNGLNGYLNIITGSLCLIPGLMIGFPDRGKRLLRLTLVAISVTLALGGVLFALYYFTNAAEFLKSLGGYLTSGVSLWLLIGGSGIFYILYLFVKRYFGESITDGRIHTLQIQLNERTVTISALLDTGHTLKEPISNASVIVAEFDVVKTILPPSMNNLFAESKEDDLGQVLSRVYEGDFQSRVRLIPFRALGGGGMLLGFRPDEVLVVDEKGQRAIKNVVIGVYNDKLSEGSFNGLMGRGLI